MEKSVDWQFDSYMQEIFQMKEVDIREYSPLALAYIGDCIFDLVKYINTTTDAESSKEYLQKLFDLLVKLTGVLGLIVDKKEEILDEDIEKLIEERQAARKAKDFARADAIRDELLEKGIILKDTREGVQWKRA